MIRNPTFHYDYILKSPGAPEFHAQVQRAFSSFSNEEVLGGKIPRLLYALDGTTRNSAYMMHLYKRFGQNTFVVGPKVQDLFRRTQLHKVTPEMIVPPVPAFYVGLADCPWQIWGGDRTQLHHLTGLYVTFNKVFQGNKPVYHVPDESRLHDCINIFLWGKANERSIDQYDDVVLWFSVSLDKWVAGGQDLETFFANHSVMTAEAHDLKDWEPTAAELDPFAPAYVPENPEALAAQREALVNVLRLVLNICLYMGSDEPDVRIEDGNDKVKELEKKLGSKKSPGKRKKLERQIQNTPRTRVIYVGPLFEELPGPEERALQEREHKGGTHASPVQHGVAPHWQRYWVGSGADRHVKWTLKGMYVRGSGKADRTITKIRE